MKKGILLLIILLVSCPLVLGGTIHGKVFTYTLGLAENSIVMIDTVPEQMVVSVDGTYSFNVPIGYYVLSAHLKDEFDNVKFSVQENISVVDDGDYVRDLILFPSEDLGELVLENDIEQDLVPDSDKKETPLYLRIIISLILLAILGLILWLVLKDKGKKRDLLGIDEADDTADLLAFIKKHKRVTQKDIRKEFPMSEAKISLMITDLESQGKIRKIKKGRGNVIIFVKD